MRDLERNKQKIYYALYQNNQPVYETDENGDIIYIDINGEQVPVDTGATVSGYSNPAELMINVSASKGDSENTVFGKSLDYERVMSTHDLTLLIDEHSHLWVDVAPVINEDGKTSTEHDYEVKAVSKSINNVLYAIKKC